MDLLRTTLASAPAVVGALGLAAACSGLTTAPFEDSAGLGLVEGFGSSVVVDGLSNPTSVSFDEDGTPIICDSAHGRVIAVMDGEVRVLLDGFDTEHWKVDAESGAKRYKLGPLSAIIAGGGILVSDAGKKDGAETLNLYSDNGETTASPTLRSNPVPPTTDDAADKGEGNLSGMALSADGSTVWTCGQGFDGKSWLLKLDLETMKLEPFLSADDHGIATNSPMQAVTVGDDRVLVLYSGAGGKVDGRVVEWDIQEKKVLRQWAVPTLINPMGMALVPGSPTEGTLHVAMVENHWALTQTNEGHLAHVALPAEGGEAVVTPLATKLQGAVHCAFAPDGALHITQLGKEYDGTHGSVVRVEGPFKGS